MFNCFCNDEGRSCGMMAWGWLVCQFGASAKGETGSSFSLHLPFSPPSNVPFHRRPQAPACLTAVSGQVLKFFTACH